jgi:hypothetical protein
VEDPRWTALIERLALAARHCREMDEALEAIRLPGAVTFPGTENPERTELVLTAEFVEPLALLRLGLLLGEVVHQCRSALDNMVWQLAAEATAPNEPPSTTSFPIFEHRREFRRKQADGTPHPSSGLAKISTLPQPAQDRIEELQPFHTSGGGNRHALTLIRDLHDGDKHRVPVVTAIQARDVTFNLHLEMQSEDDPPEVDIDLLNDGRVQHGQPAIVLRRRAPWTKISAEVHWNGQFLVEVAPGQTPGLEVVTSSVLSQAAGALSHLASFFGADPASPFEAITNRS